MVCPNNLALCSPFLELWSWCPCRRIMYVVIVENVFSFWCSTCNALCLDFHLSSKLTNCFEGKLEHYQIIKWRSRTVKNKTRARAHSNWFNSIWFDFIHNKNIKTTQTAEEIQTKTAKSATTEAEHEWRWTRAECSKTFSSKKKFKNLDVKELYKKYICIYVHVGLYMYVFIYLWLNTKERWYMNTF